MAFPSGLRSNLRRLAHLSGTPGVYLGHAARRFRPPTDSSEHSIVGENAATSWSRLSSGQKSGPARTFLAPHRTARADFAFAPSTPVR